MNYNHLIDSLKISTKIWRCHAMFLNHFYAKIYFIHEIFWALHSVFLLWSRVHFALQPIQIFLPGLHQNYGILVVAYDSTLCKNLVLFFENFEWINLFFILVQPCDFYYNPIYFCSSDLVPSPICSQPYKTPKSRSTHPFEYFWFMK